MANPEQTSDGPLSLRVTVGGRSATFALPDGGHVLIGRSNQADVRIDDPSVSREHAVLAIGVPLRLEDLGSANGTRVRGQAIRPETPVAVAPGESIDVGDVRLVVEHGRHE